MSDCQTPTLQVRPTCYEVGFLPPSDADARVFNLRVEERDEGSWAVLHGGSCLRTSGGWDYEPLPSSRTDRWLKQHRFSLEAALELARQQAPQVRVNGRTVLQWLEEREPQVEPVPVVASAQRELGL
jgi:hypothetical protein